ncbi:MAG: amidohydrolase family protein [Elusimicrobiaceae bacterium]|jgi:5-methylthioadenosine/S-adenosylhomocysteine deaminase
MTLLLNPIIVTMDGKRRVLRGKSILVNKEKIAAIADESELRKKYDLRKCPVIDCSGKIALPGFINSHTHAAMSLFKGIGHHNWDHIYKLMFPVERKLTPQDVYLLARLGVLEMLKGGTTCFADHYYFISDVAKAAKEFGLRGVLGHTLMDIKGPHKGPKEFAKALKFNEEFSSDPLITPCMAPHATETITPEYLTKIIATAKRHNLLIHMHVAQTKSEYDYIGKTFSKTPVEYLRDMGAFDCRFMGAHCIYLSKSDTKIMAKHNASVTFTPSSEIVFEKLPPIQKMTDSGVNIALGTDCVGTSDLMSPLHEMKKAFYALVQEYGPQCGLEPVRMLEMFTINAANALGLGDRIGSLETGKLADIVLLDSEVSEFNPIYDVITNVVLCSLESHISAVMVNGNVVFKNHAPVFADEKEVILSAHKRSAAIISTIPAFKKLA